jgi:hypothetical protein
MLDENIIKPIYINRTLNIKLPTPLTYAAGLMNLSDFSGSPRPRLAMTLGRKPLV